MFEEIWVKGVFEVIIKLIGDKGLEFYNGNIIIDLKSINMIIIKIYISYYKLFIT